MHQPFRMDPAQGMLADVELSCIVAQHHGVAQETVCMDAAPLSPLGGNLHRVLNDRQAGLFGRDDAKPVQMGLPRRLVNEMRFLRFGQAGDQGDGQSAAAQIAERRLVQHVVGMTGAQQIEEVQAGVG